MYVDNKEFAGCIIVIILMIFAAAVGGYRVGKENGVKQTQQEAVDVDVAAWCVDKQGVVVFRWREAKNVGSTK